MELTLHNPWTVLSRDRDFFDRAQRALDEALGLRATGAAPARPALRWTEDEAAFTLTAEVPGLGPDDVAVEVHDGVLSVVAARTETLPEDEQARRVERRAFRIERRFRLPEDVAADGIEARVEHGLLTVTLTRTAAPEPRRIAVRGGQED